jgi:hypothetical protein
VQGTDEGNSSPDLDVREDLEAAAQAQIVATAASAQRSGRAQSRTHGSVTRLKVSTRGLQRLNHPLK